MAKYGDWGIADSGRELGIFILRIQLITACLAVAAATGSPASAQFVEEVRLNVMKHDLNPFGADSGKENGVNVVGEVVFAGPDFFKYVLSPRPYALYSWNSSGDTDFWSAGLTWDQDIYGRVYGEVSFGIANHDGVTELPPDPGDPNRIRLDATRIVFGSQWQFRAAGALGVRVTDRIDAAIVYEHLSHGQVFGDGRNEGLDTAGVRLAYKFGRARND